MADAVGDKLRGQQRHSLEARVAGSEHLPDEPPGHADLIGPTADDQALPRLQLGDCALTGHGMTSRDIGKRSRHSSSFPPGADTELINDLFMRMFSTESRNILSIYQYQTPAQ